MAHPPRRGYLEAEVNMDRSPNWLLPAKSIPPWPGAKMVSSAPSQIGARGPTFCLVERNIDEGRVIEVGAISEEEEWPVADMEADEVVDLSNPDTFAAARDRLAVAMGAPPEKVREGVIFAWSDKKLWTLRAGLDPRQPGVWVEGITTFEADEDPVSRELALALAWQRVVGS